MARRRGVANALVITARLSDQETLADPSSARAVLGTVRGGQAAAKPVKQARFSPEQP